MIILQPNLGYRYNTDTMMLYDFVYQGGLKGDVLEVGCGCGVLGLMLKRDFSKISLDMLDVQEININLARQNSQNNAIFANFILDDFTNFKSQKRYDFVISNPPFYRNNIKKSENLHMQISRYSEFLPLESLIKSANSILKPSGSLIFCYEAGRVGEIFNLLQKYKLNPTRIKFIHPKPCKEANLLLIEAKKSSKSMAKILPATTIYDGENYSKEAGEIFARADTISKSVEI